jgi:enoyl-CoA hydratase
MAVFAFGRPVVAAVNGHAIAGGAVLAFAADQRVMAQGKGRIGTPELLVGVAFPRAPLELVVHAVGEQVARKLLFGAETYGPDQALALGMVDELAEPDALVPRAVELAARMATAIPADAFGHSKLQLRRQAIERIVNYQLDEDPKALEIWTTRTEDGWMAGYLAQATSKK